MRFLVTQKTSNFRRFVRWAEYLNSPEFMADWRRRMNSNSSRNQYTQLARDVVESDIYSISKGEGNIERSFQTDPKEDTVGVTVYSDPAIAPSKAGKNPGEFSYAAFFERPVQWDSFIKGSHDYDPIRYRPFFEHMTEVINEQAKNDGQRRFMQAVRFRMPRTDVATE